MIKHWKNWINFDFSWCAIWAWKVAEITVTHALIVEGASKNLLVEIEIRGVSSDGANN